ncbi:MAG: metallopeptidase family protein [Anaerolineae bacterium]
MKRVHFERLVAEALDELPEEFQRRLDNVEVVIEDRPSRQDLASVGLKPGQTLFGLYQGVPRTKRTSGYGLVLPDKITIYQRPIEMACRTEAEIREQVRQTVMHEIAHHFGLDDEDLARLKS